MQASSLKLCPFPLHTHYISFHSSIKFTTWTGADTRRETEYSLDRTPFIRYLMYNTETCNICPFIQLATQISISETWPWTAAANCQSKQPCSHCTWNWDETMIILRQPQVATPTTAFFLALVLWLFFFSTRGYCLLNVWQSALLILGGRCLCWHGFSINNHNQLQPHLEVFV